jgi:hypothetical protein
MSRPETPEPPEPLRRWLDEELAAGVTEAAVAAVADIGEASDAAADEALAALFAAVAPLSPRSSQSPLSPLSPLSPVSPLWSSAPPAGFADRVMARLALEAQAAAPLRPHRAPGRDAVAPRAGGGLAGAFRRRAPAAPAGAAPRRSARGRRLTVGLGLAAAAAVLVALEIPLWLPLVLRGLQSLVSASSISWVLQAAIDGAQGLAQVTAAVVSWADTLLLLVMAVAKPLAVPPIAAFAALALAISVLSLRSLHALIQRDRRWVYADPI